MAAATAGAGAGAGSAQEKQFPPALLSFFIYNPRFGPREGEVGGAGPRAGAGGGGGGGGQGAAGRRRSRAAAGCAREAAPGSTCQTALVERQLPGGLASGVCRGQGAAAGAGQRRQGLLRVLEQCLCME